MSRATRDVTALVLAGGHSRRFGPADKARHRVQGRSMIRHACDAAQAAAGGVLLVSVRAGQEYFAEAPDDAHYVEDAASEAGPLAGLVAGLRACRTEWLLALACDLPFVTPDTLGRLLAARAPDADAVAAETPDGRRQPLCACYRRSATLPLAEEHLRSETLALQALLDRLSVRTVAFDERTLRNVNRPADLRDLEE